MINNEIAKHIYKTEIYQDRDIALYLSFRGKVTIQLIGIYEFSNHYDRQTKGKDLNKWVDKKLNEALNNDYISIILGDFNGVPNPKLDRIQYDINKIEMKILKMLTYRGYQDSYRLFNNTKKEYTFFRKKNGDRIPSSRIDQIWISHQHAGEIIDAFIKPTETTAYSDHNATVTYLDIRKWCHNTQYNKNRRHFKNKGLWNLKGTSQEQ